MQGMACRSPVLCMLLAPVARFIHREPGLIATFSTSTTLHKRYKPRHLKSRALNESGVPVHAGIRHIDIGETTGVPRKSDDELYTAPDSKYVRLTRNLIKTTAEREQSLWGYTLERMNEFAEAKDLLYADAKSAELPCPRAIKAGYVREKVAGLSSILETAHEDIDGAVEELRSLVPAMLAEPLPSEEVIWRREGVDVSKVDLEELERDIAVATTKREILFKKQSAAINILENASRQYKTDKDRGALLRNVVRAVDSFNGSSYVQDGRQMTEEDIKKILKARPLPDVDSDVWGSDLS